MTRSKRLYWFRLASDIAIAMAVSMLFLSFLLMLFTPEVFPWISTR